MFKQSFFYKLFVYVLSVRCEHVEEVLRRARKPALRISTIRPSPFAIDNH